MAGMTMRRALRLITLIGAVNTLDYELGWAEAVEHTLGVTYGSRRKVAGLRRRRQTASRKVTAMLNELMDAAE